MPQPIPEWVAPDTRIILDWLNRLEGVALMTQQQVDDLTQQISDQNASLQATLTSMDQSLKNIQADIDELKGQVTEPPLDFTALEAEVATLTTLTSSLAGEAGEAAGIDEQTPPPPPP